MKPPVKKRKALSFIAARRLFAGRQNDTFRQRGEDITRIEALSDAVFAFSISLLIMSLEVPQTFTELKLILQTFLPFAATVCLVVLFWYQQCRFFRNYGLNDLRVIVLNVALLLTILFYVYPLKFLFSLLFGMLLRINFFLKATAHGETVLTQQEFPQLIMIYSAGYIAIWVIFFLLYLHAWRLRRTLQLTAFETEDTKRQIKGALIDMLIGLASFCFAWGGHPGLAGLCFVLIAPSMMLNDWWFRKRLKKKLILYRKPEI